MFALSVYLTVGVPSSRTVAEPVVGVDTRSDQIEALRILSAGNSIIIVLLGAILALQVMYTSDSMCRIMLTDIFTLSRFYVIDFVTKLLLDVHARLIGISWDRLGRSTQGVRKLRKGRSGTKKRRKQSLPPLVRRLRAKRTSRVLRLYLAMDLG